MPIEKIEPRRPFIERISHTISGWASTSAALVSVSIILLIWFISGFIFHFPDAWHLSITTGSAAISVFMIFVLTRAQSKDTAAMQIKLNEIIAVLHLADNKVIDAENLSEREIEKLAEEKRNR